MKKVAHVQLFPILSGVQRVSLSEIEVLRGNYEYYMICKEGGALTNASRELGVRCFFISSFRREISAFQDFKSLINLIRLFKNIRPDVVHTHSSKTGILGRVAAKLSGCKNVVHTVHGYAFPAASSRFSYVIYFVLEYIAKWFTDTLIVLNETDRDVAIHSLRFSPSKVMLLPNGVRLPAEGGSKEERKKFVVAMVARLSYQKDPQTFIRAAIALVERYDDIVFRLIGDGELSDAIEKQLKGSKDRERIELSGWMANPNQVYLDADLFVLSSLWEGMPLAILEAMSYSLPCVVTDIPGNRDLVSVGENGYTFPAGDSEALAKNIEVYYLNRELTIKHGGKSRTLVEQHYLLDKRCIKLKSDVY